MKVLHINTHDHGGAGAACIRLHNGLLQSGIDSSVLTFKRTTEGIQSHHQCAPVKKTGLIQRIKIRAGIEQPLYIRQHRALENKPAGFEYFSFPETDFDISGCDAVRNAEIINLHWVGDYIDYPSFFSKVRKPIVWTLHDMNPFTGGCHYSGECDRYKGDCPDCPQLQGTRNPDISRTNWYIKNDPSPHERLI